MWDVLRDAGDSWALGGVDVEGLQIPIAETVHQLVEAPSFSFSPSFCCDSPADLRAV